VLRQFWLDSFVASAADARMHRHVPVQVIHNVQMTHYLTACHNRQVVCTRTALRDLSSSSIPSLDLVSACMLPPFRTRFVPPGARQGPNTRGVIGTSSDGCSGDLSTWITEPNATVRTALLDSCLYNAGVIAPGVQPVHVDACFNQFLASNATTGARAATCYSGTTWLYTHANRCERMSEDMRLTRRVGADTDKCGARVAGQYVEVDDFWGAMASNNHDPCGWPFVECVADCSLPSNPASKGWYVNATSGLVHTSANEVVGCSDMTNCSTANPHRMRDPRIANQIAAM